MGINASVVVVDGVGVVVVVVVVVVGHQLHLLLDLEKLVCLGTWERGGNLLNTFQVGQTSIDIASIVGASVVGRARIDPMNRTIQQPFNASIFLGLAEKNSASVTSETFPLKRKAV